MPAKSLVMGLAAIGISATALAQPPTVLSYPNGPGAIPPVTAPYPAAPDPVGISPRPAPPTQNTLSSYLGVSPEQQEYRRREAMRTPAGQLRDKVQEPLSKATGGLIKPYAPKTPSLAELQAPGAIGTAAQIKLDRATAEDRMKAVAYLGTVDCRTWPEAEAALIGALRSDRNECVRLKAATVLAGGRCCTKKSIAALTHSATGSDCDGGLAEPSARVRCAAQVALDKCLACFIEYESSCPDRENCDKKPQPQPLPQLDPLPKSVNPVREGGKGEAGGPLPSPRDLPKGEGERNQGGVTSPDAYYAQVSKKASADVILEARRALVVPVSYTGPASRVNPLDAEAAGTPGADNAAGRSPRQASLLSLLTRSNPTPTSGVPIPAVPGHPAAAPWNVVRGPEVAPPAFPSGTLSFMTPPMATAAPVPFKPAPVFTPPTATAAPMPPKPAPVFTPPPAPVVSVPAPPVPVNVPRPSPAPVAPVSAGPPALVIPPAPVAAPMPLALRPPESQGERVFKMFQGLTPIDELTAGLNRLTREDLRTTQRLVNEIITVGCKATAAQLRQASAGALVRCRMDSPAAAAALTALATSDPDKGVQAAARGESK